MKKRVAIIGTGIAGMACASQLHRDFDIHVFEKNSYIGGHTNTIEVESEGAKIAIDTGFMVYNEVTYPLLTNLFSELGIETYPTKMSFSVQSLSAGLEFAGTGFNGLFCQRSNIVSLRHWKLLIEIQRFNRSCEEVLENSNFNQMTLGDYFEEKKYSRDFINHYLIPMGSAVWSSSPEEMLKFPAVTLIRFFSNHRFLSLHGQLLWRTVKGGSCRYRDRLIKSFQDRIKINSEIKVVSENSASVSLKKIDGYTLEFDAVVLACHADQSLQLIENPSAIQKALLGPWKYQKNTAILHKDSSVMPKSNGAWTSWNYRLDARGPSTIYWMNSLQSLDTRENFFVSINREDLIDPASVVCKLEYEHPLFTLSALSTQNHLQTLNEQGRIFFCGSYFRYGFHEDALWSALATAEKVRTRLG